MFRRIVFVLVISLVISHPIKAQKDYKANSSAAIAVSDNEVCALSVARMEEKYAIKNHLLETIASVETGLWDYEAQKFVSWPWSINVNGKGYRFDSKDEAVAEVKHLQKQGITSIDVGCMQISLKFHGKSFKSVEEAFDPDANVEYSAKFLKKLYDKTGSWKSAAMAYHSKVRHRAEIYKAKLLKRFDEIKVAFLDYHQDLSLF